MDPNKPDRNIQHPKNYYDGPHHHPKLSHQGPPQMIPVPTILLIRPSMYIAQQPYYSQVTGTNPNLHPPEQQYFPRSLSGMLSNAYGINNAGAQWVNGNHHQGVPVSNPIGVAEQTVMSQYGNVYSEFPPAPCRLSTYLIPGATCQQAGRDRVVAPKKSLLVITHPDTNEEVIVSRTTNEDKTDFEAPSVVTSKVEPVTQLHQLPVSVCVKDEETIQLAEKTRSTTSSASASGQVRQSLSGSLQDEVMKRSAVTPVFPEQNHIINGNVRTTTRVTYKKEVLLSLENVSKNVLKPEWRIWVIKTNPQPAPTQAPKTSMTHPRSGPAKLESIEAILLTVRSLLNKLTPSNFEKLSSQLLALPFTKSHEKLTGTVDLIFDKALDELKYAELYAKLCWILFQEKATDLEGNQVKVRTILLQRAQSYFEKTDKETTEAAEDQPGVSLEDAIEKRNKAKRRYMGNIRFISELYKHKMLTEKVILNCFHRLLPKKADFSDADEEKLECLCKLLMTCGLMLKAGQNADAVQEFYTHLESMIKARATSPRIRFLMQDAIDLKNNNYIQLSDIVAPDNVKPKFKEEKHQEELANEKAVVNLPGPPSRGGQMPMEYRQIPDHHQRSSFRETTKAGSAFSRTNTHADRRSRGGMESDNKVRVAGVAPQPPKTFIRSLCQITQPSQQQMSLKPAGPIKPDTGRCYDSRPDNRQADSSLTTQPSGQQLPARPTPIQPDTGSYNSRADNRPTDSSSDSSPDFNPDSRAL